MCQPRGRDRTAARHRAAARANPGGIHAIGDRRRAGFTAAGRGRRDARDGADAGVVDTPFDALLDELELCRGGAHAG